MSQLNKIIGLFPEGGPAKPAPEVIAKICAIDEAIRGTREELERVLQELENINRDNWNLGNMRWWNEFEGTKFARFPEHNENSFTDLVSLSEIHRARYATVAKIFVNQSVSIEDGGIKTFTRAKKKLERKRRLSRPDNCPDLSRVRLVVHGLTGLDDAYHRLLVYMPLRQVGNFSHYAVNGNMIKKYQTPFRGVLTNWCGFDEENASDQIATEVQLVTDRIRTVMDIDHPFNAAQVIKYPDEETKDYIYSLMLKASILDFQERFGV
jgi:hypothetical protein